MTPIKIWVAAMALFFGPSRACGQIDQPVESTRTWSALFVNGSRDSAQNSGALFRESLGMGISKPLSHAWSFSPSLWCVAKESSRATRANIEGHAALGWHHAFHAGWYLYSGVTVEVASDTPYPYLEQRAEVRRNSKFKGRRLSPFALWDVLYRTDGEYLDAQRVRAGIRIPLQSRLEMVPMFSRRDRLNGAALLFVYDLSSLPGFVSRSAKHDNTNVQ